MKIVIRFFMAALLLGLCSFGYSQAVKVNINNQDATTKDDCPYRINGICATEDIGGVNVDFVKVLREGGDGTKHYDHCMVLTNYNSFPVNVLWQIKYTGNDPHCDAYNSVKTGNVVVGATGEKEITLDYDCYLEWTLKGLIVRKLAQ